METNGRTLQVRAEVRHLLDLMRAGIDGVNSARKAASGPVWKNSVWLPAALGALAGACTASLRRRSRYTVAASGLVGSGLGLGCGLAWRSRGFTAALARGAMRNIATVQDLRWLEENPIDYA